MAGPEFVAPDTATWEMTADQYQKLLQILKAENVPCSVTASSGVAEYAHINFTWSYNGTTLTLRILSVHSMMAKIAGNTAIFNEINEKIMSQLG